MDKIYRIKGRYREFFTSRQANARYEILDEEGDLVLVIPVKKDGTTAALSTFEHCTMWLRREALDETGEVVG